MNNYSFTPQVGMGVVQVPAPNAAFDPMSNAWLSETAALLNTPVAKETQLQLSAVEAGRLGLKGCDEAY